jgi:Ca2+/Na+ antiporter
MLFAQWKGYSNGLTEVRSRLSNGAQKTLQAKTSFASVRSFAPEDYVHRAHSLLKMPTRASDRVAFLIGFPMSLVLHLTMPDCRTARFKGMFLLTMLGAVVWLGILVTIMLQWAAKWGCLWNISPALLGMTVCAAGTSLPDFLASLSVARTGEGAMAVSNAIGSNIFDLAIGLGFPFMVKTLIYGPEQVSKAGIVEAVLLLLGLQLVFTIAVAVTHLHLPRFYGYIFVFTYFAFLVWQVMSLA